MATPSFYERLDDSECQPGSQGRHARILAADKHASTVAKVRKLLPGVAVDGICTVNELLSHRAADYPIIIIRLFLTRDPEQPSTCDCSDRRAAPPYNVYTDIGDYANQASVGSPDTA
ncbi:hypothetical protein BJV82DRAFT_582573 [Fennellomyces sp. T-0311]|nr:hypothetical protein BJV82DRAFT_582573 [Fennellomyces sp. T-0311]